MARQARRSSSRQTGASAGAGRGRPRQADVSADRTDDLLEEIDAVLDSVHPDASGQRARQEPADHDDIDSDDLPDYATLHRWLGFMCVTLFIWIVLVSTLGGPFLWIRYGMH